MNTAVAWSASPGVDVCICGIGARTPLGFGVGPSAAAVRGGLSALAAHPFFRDHADDPVSLAHDAAFDPRLGIAARMEEMVVSAIAEACGEALVPAESRGLRCLIGLPESRPGLPAGIVDTVISTVSEQFGIAPSAIRALPCGHASGLMAMQAAAEAISSSEANVFLVAGVDSYHDPDTLHALDETGALMSAHHRNGFSPGEAAGACVLASRSAAHGAGLPILATVTAAATSVERHTIRSSTVCIGEGLTTAFRGAISRLHLPQQAITDTYCDLNGQRYRTEELVYTLLRVQEAFVDAHDYRCPADCWGDVGAASGPLFAALAIVASQRGYSNGPYPALWAGSESGHRTVALLTTTPRHRATSI